MVNECITYWYSKPIIVVNKPEYLKTAADQQCEAFARAWYTDKESKFLEGLASFWVYIYLPYTNLDYNTRIM